MAYWRLDEGSGGTAYDTATAGSYADNGTITGSPTWLASGSSHIGNALSFNGSSQYVTINSSSDMNISGFDGTELTLATWAKSGAANWNSSDSFLSSSSYSLGGVSGSTTVEFRLALANSGSSPTWKTLSYTPNSVTGWNQYAASYDGVTMRLYDDGSLVASLAILGGINSVSGPMYLASNGASGYLNGSLDEVRIYSNTLSASQIATLYSQSSLAVTGLTPTSSLSSSSYHAQSFNFGGGVNQYGDISGSFSSPGQYLGSTFIQTANADNANASFSLGFTINTPTTVYVLSDNAITTKPTWLTGGFTSTGQTLTNSGGHTFTVYKALFASGTVSVGANGGNGSSQMYSVLLAPLAAEYSSAVVGNVAAYGSWGSHSGTVLSQNGEFWPDYVVTFTGTNNGWWAGMSIESYDGDYNDVSFANPVTVFAPAAFGGTNYSNTPIAWVGTSQEPGLGGVEGPAYMGAWARGFSSLEAAWAGDLVSSFIAVTDIQLEQTAPTINPASSAAPTVQTPTVISSNQINVSWTAASQPNSDFTVTGYGIWRAPDVGGTPGTFALVGAVGATSTNYTDTGLSAGTKYWYKVEAVFNGDVLLYSTNQLSATTLATPSSLVGYWRLDEGSGNMAYDTATGGSPADNGTLVNGPTWATGHNGNALSFNGTNQYVSVSNSSDLNISGSQITLAVWAKSTSATAWNSVDDFISRDGGTYTYGYTLGPTGSGKSIEMWLYINGPGWEVISYTPTVDISQWHNYAGTYDGSNMRLYVDGALVATQAQTGTIAGNSSGVGVNLGYDTFDGRYLSGSLDDARIYNAKLTDAAIASLYGEANFSVTGLTPTGSNSSSSYHAQSFNFGASGINQYGDISGSFATPGQYLGSTFIQTANADNANTNFSLTFTINTPSTVYVLFDNAIPNPPSWLTSEFTSTGQTITNSAGHTFTIYKSVYQSGTITLGANDGNVNSEMYSVLFAPLAWDSTDKLVW